MTKQSEPCGSLAGNFPEARYARQHVEANTKPGDTRTPAEKDRGRVAYSPYLRRLSGVAQVVTPSAHSAMRHTRESHSQKVALVAREIAESLVRRASKDAELKAALIRLGGVCIPACETAGMAHDLGHPPYGHAGEVELNRLLRERDVPDGFQGNAQTFRILTRLERRKPTENFLGLNLTAVTLAAVLKYPTRCPEDSLLGGKDSDLALADPPKFCVYTDDFEPFKFAMNSLGIEVVGDASARSVEASIMDLADDIAYAYHDLEDLHKEGAFDFDAILNDLNGAVNYLSKHPVASGSENAFVRIGAELKKKFPAYFSEELYLKALHQTKLLIDQAQLAERFDGSPVTSALMTMAMSYSMSQMFSSVVVNEEHPQGPVVLSEQSWHNLQPLKTITRRYIIDSAAMGQLEFAQRKVIGGLFSLLEEWLRSSPPARLLPEPLSSFLVDTEGALDVGRNVVPELSAAVYRAISDYICTLSDEEALDRFHWLSGAVLPALRPSL